MLALTAVWPLTYSMPSVRFGPWCDSSGNIYFVGWNSTVLAMWRSTDGGSTWTAYNSTISSIGGNIDCTYDSTNQIVYMVVPTSAHVLQIWKFTISTLVWAQFSTGTGPTVTAGGSSAYCCAIAMRSTGVFVVPYQGPTTSVMGTAYRQMYYATCSAAGAWGTATLMFSGSSSSQQVDGPKTAITGASDRVHVLFGYQSGQAHISLSSANALDTGGFFSSASTGQNAGALMAYIPGTSQGLFKDYGGSAQVSRFPSQANPTPAQDTGTPVNDSYSTCATVLVYDATSGRVYQVYRDSSTADIFQAYTTSTAWSGTVTSVDAATSPVLISANSLNPARNAIGVLWVESSNGAMYWDTITLGPPPKIGTVADSIPNVGTDSAKVSHIGTSAKATESIAVSDAATRIRSLARTATDAQLYNKPVYSQAILQEPGLVSYWRLGETSGTFADSKDSNPASVGSGAGLTRGVAGLLTGGSPSAGVQSDGTAGSNVQVPDAANLHTGSQLTVECWVKPTSLVASSANGYFLSKQYSATNWFFQYLGSGDGRTRFYVRPATGSDSQVTTSPVFAAGSTYHMVGVFDAVVNNNQIIYMNGAASTPQAVTNGSTVSTSAQPVFMLTSDPATTAGFPGVLGDVAIYNVALSPAQISAHYNAGTTAPVTAIGDSANAIVVHSFTRTASDAVGAIADVATRATFARVRTAADGVTISDAAARALQAFIRTVTEVVAITDAATRIKVGARTAADSVATISDLATHAAVGSSRSAADTFSIADVATRAVRAMTRTSADTLSVADSSTGVAVHGYTRTSTDAFTITDATSRAAGARTRTSVESFTIADAAVRATYARARNATDSFLITDTTAGIKVVARSASDATICADAATRAGVYLHCTGSDLYVVADAALRGGYARARSSTDAFSTFDAASRTKTTVPRGGIDVTTITDAAALTKESETRTSSDSWTTADAATRATYARARSSSDTWAIADTASRTAVTFLRTASDVVTITDLGLAGGGVRYGSDAWGIADYASRAAFALTRTAADGWAVLDSTSRDLIARVRYVLDLVTIEDEAIGIAAVVSKETLLYVTETTADILLLETVAPLNLVESTATIGIMQTDNDPVITEEVGAITIEEETY